MRITNVRLAILICALGAMSESLFYTALAPLLDQMDATRGHGHENGGLLVAAYPLGYWLAAYPAFRLVARVGPRWTAVAGIGTACVATLMFAFGDAFALLLLARAIVGAGSVTAYTGVLAAAGAMAGPERRGAAIGTVYGGSAVGSAVGPLVGALAAGLGRGPVFAGVAAGQAIVALLLTRLPDLPPAPSLSPRAALDHLRSTRVRIGLWITSIPGFALGVLTVAGTYRLHEVGAGTVLVGIAFSGVAVINVLLAPQLGHASDRIGRKRPVMLALAAAGLAVAVIIAAAFEVPTIVLISITGACMLAVAGPGLALIGDGIIEDGGDPAGATFLMNVFWGPAAALGAIAAGLVHGGFGAELALLLLLAVTVISVPLVRRYA